jgi:hypothetical protein
MRFILLFISILSFFSQILIAQMDAQSLVKSLTKKIQEVDNYSVDILVKVDVEFIKIEDRKAKVFFEKPDKFEIKSSGLLLLPKKGVEMEYLQLLNTEFTAIDEKKEDIDGVQTRLVKVIPMGSDIDIVLAQLWIDEQKMRISRMKTYTKSSGSYTIDFSYNNNPFDLPSAIRVEFDVKNMTLPSTITSDPQDIMKNLEKKGVTKGVVYVTYSGYEVNKAKK